MVGFGESDTIHDLEQELARERAARQAAEFWCRVYPEGATLEQVQNELYDYHMVLEEVTKVYCEITGGKISKPNTKAEEVIQCVEDEIQQTVKDVVAELEQENNHLQNALDALAEGWRDAEE